jgi:hypothetical protein
MSGRVIAWGFRIAVMQRSDSQLGRLPCGRNNVIPAGLGARVRVAATSAFQPATQRASDNAIVELTRPLGCGWYPRVWERRRKHGANSGPVSD